MEKFEKDAVIGGSIQPRVIPVIQGSDTGGPAVLFGVMGAIKRDDEGSGGHLCMWQEDGTWEKLAAEEVLRAAGT